MQGFCGQETVIFSDKVFQEWQKIMGDERKLLRCLAYEVFNLISYGVHWVELKMPNFGWSVEVYYEGVKNIMYINVKTPDKYSFY